MPSGSTPLEDLPAELLLRVVDLLPLRHRCSLSSVNSQFRRFMAPFLFRAVKVSNTGTNPEEIPTFFGKSGKFVEKLYFTCYLLPDREHVGWDWRRWDEEQSRPDFEEQEAPRLARGPPEQILSQELKDLLNGKLKLPELFAAKTSFASESDYYLVALGEWDDLGYHPEEVIMFNEFREDAEDVAKAESMYRWLQTIDETFANLAQNRCITDLDIVDLPPKSCSAFETGRWRMFLGRLISLRIALWSPEVEDPNYDYVCSCSEGYRDFVKSLSGTLVRHLFSLTKLVFVADVNSPPGLLQRDGNTFLARLHAEHQRTGAQELLH